MPKLHASGAVTHDAVEASAPAASAAPEEVTEVQLDDGGAADDSPQPAKKAAPAKKAPARKKA